MVWEETAGIGIAKEWRRPNDTNTATRMRIIRRYLTTVNNRFQGYFFFFMIFEKNYTEIRTFFRYLL